MNYVITDQSKREFPARDHIDADRIIGELRARFGAKFSGIKIRAVPDDQSPLKDGLGEATERGAA